MAKRWKRTLTVILGAFLSLIGLPLTSLFVLTLVGLGSTPLSLLPYFVVSIVLVTLGLFLISRRKGSFVAASLLAGIAVIFFIWGFLGSSVPGLPDFPSGFLALLGALLLLGPRRILRARPTVASVCISALLTIALFDGPLILTPISGGTFEAFRIGVALSEPQAGPLVGTLVVQNTGPYAIDNASFQMINKHILVPGPINPGQDITLSFFVSSLANQSALSTAYGCTATSCLGSIYIYYRGQNIGGPRNPQPSWFQIPISPLQTSVTAIFSDGTAAVITRPLFSNENAGKGASLAFQLAVDAKGNLTWIVSVSNIGYKSITSPLIADAIATANWQAFYWTGAASANISSTFMRLFNFGYVTSCSGGPNVAGFAVCQLVESSMPVATLAFPTVTATSPLQPGQVATERLSMNLTQR